MVIMIEVGERFKSVVGNIYRVVGIGTQRPTPLIAVIRENAAGRWDEGHVHHWIPDAFDGMERLQAVTPYTHVGRLAWTGSYAVTADAYRKPGKVHAMNAANDGSQEFIGLCGVRVAMRSDDHFLQDEPQVVPVTPGHRITCKRALDGRGR